ncbi:MAG: hypothetical protein SGI74_08170 [Oligoflexia bacterium]|nr:hypothetical protein [Oligoflexia bacterium]
MRIHHLVLGAILLLSTNALAVGVGRVIWLCDGQVIDAYVHARKHSSGLLYKISAFKQGRNQILPLLVEPAVQNQTNNSAIAHIFRGEHSNLTIAANQNQQSILRIVINNKPHKIEMICKPMN